MSAVLSLTLSNIFSALPDIKQMTESLATHHANEEKGRIVDYTQVHELLETLQRTTETLEKMRPDLDAKELQQLRRELEAHFR